MFLYQLPKFEFPKLPKPVSQPFWKNKVFWSLAFIVFLSSLFGFLAGALSGSFLYFTIKDEILKFNISWPQILEKQKIAEREPVYLPQTSQEETIINVVKTASPAVVSIIITKDVPKLELYYGDPFEGFEQFFGQPFFEFRVPEYRQRGIERREIGGGTGFIISGDGMVLTNSHVVADEKADYTVLTNDGRRYPAKVLARDRLRDLAIMKIEREKVFDERGNLTLKPFPTLKLGDSDKLQIGQTVIAIGNALAEFRNTVSVGVISGLGRTVTAAGGGIVQTLEDVIQTDAAINRGNSGGPLFNLKGEVIGINFAMAWGAENIGFAIPVNSAKKSIEQVKEFGKIVYPFLGVRYVLINEEIQKENNLPVNYGAWVIKGDRGEPAIFPGSAAEKVGLREKDIILEFDGQKITTENSLARIIMRYNPGDKVVLKVLRNGQELNLKVILGGRSA